MNKNIKIIFIDLDGTVLNNNSQASQKTINIIKKIIEKNILVILCSGRANSNMINISKTVNSSPIIISSNGSLAFDYTKNKILYDTPINQNDLNIIWNYSCQKEIGLTLNSIFDRFKNNNSILEAKLINSLSGINSSISQIVATSINLENLENLKNYISLYSSDTESKNIWQNNKNYFEMDIFNKANSKGKAIKEILSYLNIPKDFSMCIGDQTNDISMFEECNVKVAMKNGNELLKSKSDYITDYTNNDDGVAKFLEKYFLLRN